MFAPLFTGNLHYPVIYYFLLIPTVALIFVAICLVFITENIIILQI